MYSGSRVGSWFNDWGDFTDDIKSAGSWIWNQGRAVQRTGTAVTNAGNNAANATSARIDINTLGLYAIGGLLAYEVIRTMRRSNPRGRRRR